MKPSASTLAKRLAKAKAERERRDAQATAPETEQPVAHPWREAGLARLRRKGGAR
jgi:hypothetical protein